MASRAGRRSVTRVAADANVLLSAVTGGAALRVFTHSGIEVVAAEATVAEVREYLPALGSRYGLAPEALEAQLRLLGVREYGRPQYRRQLAEAQRRAGRPSQAPARPERSAREARAGSKGAVDNE